MPPEKAAPLGFETDGKKAGKSNDEPLTGIDCRSGIRLPALPAIARLNGSVLPAASKYT